jgi:hypothetical protein
LQEFGSARAAFDDLAGVRARVGAGVAARLADPAARPTWELNCAVMAMRHDVAVSTSRLPLDAEVVRRVFREQQLVWTVNDALCVLAGVDPERLRHPRPALPTWVDGGPWDGYRERLPKLPKLPARPQHAQLSLFD